MSKIDLKEHDLMIHALGLQRSKKAYRNRFNACEKSDNCEVWRGLVKKGYAVELGKWELSRGLWFKVSKDGLNALGLSDDLIEEALQE